ncbi:hypothetical protein P691DRAFT_681335, partial [Macrolepiota fuliginosa MF-IS2]
GLKLLHDNSHPKAAYDSAAREFALYSIPKTDREDFVADFVAWTRRTTGPPVMQLNGPKSNLAQLCAEKLEENLDATFCFSRSNGTDDPGRFFTTLADQLATHNRSYAKILDGKIRHNRALVSKSLRVQFDELIAAPVGGLLAEELDLGPRKVIIVEGIDECASVHARCEILCIILKSASALPFRWAIFSRIDSQLETLLKEKGVALEPCWKVCHSVPNIPIGEGEPLFRVEMIRHEGWIAVRWTLAKRDPKIVTGTALFFFQPLK